MPYLVLGCGAIGGTVAAGLVRDGHDVLVCDADQAVVAAVNARGLRIEGPVESFAVAVPATVPDDLPPRLDGPVLVAVKAQHTAAVAAILAGRPCRPRASRPAFSWPAAAVPTWPCSGWPRPRST